MTCYWTQVAPGAAFRRICKAIKMLYISGRKPQDIYLAAVTVKQVSPDHPLCCRSFRRPYRQTRGGWARIIGALGTALMGIPRASRSPQKDG